MNAKSSLLVVGYRRVRHWLWMLARPHFGDECDGSPWRLCDECSTPDWCRRHP